MYVFLIRIMEIRERMGQVGMGTLGQNWHSNPFTYTRVVYNLLCVYGQKSEVLQLRTFLFNVRSRI